MARVDPILQPLHDDGPKTRAVLNEIRTELDFLGELKNPLLTKRRVIAARYEDWKDRQALAS